LRAAFNHGTLGLVGVDKLRTLALRRQAVACDQAESEPRLPPPLAYDLVTMPFYRSQMSPNEAAKVYREKADAYLEMTGYVRDERRRRILHELSEETEAKAELLERMMLSHEGFGAFRIRCRMN
jgi:hypothetical protein